MNIVRIYYCYINPIVKYISLKSFTLQLVLANKIPEPFQHSSKALWKKLLCFLLTKHETKKAMVISMFLKN